MIVLIPPTNDNTWQVEVPGKGIVGLENIGLNQDQIEALRNSPLTEEGVKSAVRDVFGAPPLYQHLPVTVLYSLPKA